MTELILVWKLSDGTIAMGAMGRTHEGESEQEKITRCLAKTEKELGNGTLKGAKRLTPRLRSELPGMRFFDSWRLNDGDDVQVDMPLARAQRMMEIRAERDRRFGPLDGDWMKATGQKNVTRADAVESVRQQLRDVPQTVDLEGIATPEELEAFQPEWPGV